MDDAARGQVAASAAEVYEEFFVPALFGQFAPTMVELCRIGEGDRLIDVGCGTGVVARAAIRRVGPDGEVVGVDLNPGMLTVAQRLSDRATWIEGAAEDLPFEDARFDASTCQFALMFFADRRRALEEMARVTCPGSPVVVATWAAVSESPGYAAMVELLDQEIGRDAGDALRAPFHIGSEEQLGSMLEEVFDRVDVRTHPGTARFASLEAWMHTDIRGWTLTDMIDEDTFDELLAAAKTRLDRFVGIDGCVEFPAPALIGVSST